MSNTKHKPRYFQMLNIDDSVMVSFRINHTKTEKIPSHELEDGSFYPGGEFYFVSDCGFSWYQVYGGRQDRILTEEDYIDSLKQTQP